MAMIRSKGGVVLNKYLVARVFAFDDHETEARAALKGTGSSSGAKSTSTVSAVGGGSASSRKTVPSSP